MTKVDEGSAQVAAGELMQQIVASVQRVTDIMGEISAASQEQASGISQVNQAVTQMDQNTQQNAAPGGGGRSRCRLTGSADPPFAASRLALSAARRCGPEGLIQHEPGVAKPHPSLRLRRAELCPPGRWSAPHWRPLLLPLPASLLRALPHLMMGAIGDL